MDYIDYRASRAGRTSTLAVRASLFLCQCGLTRLRASPFPCKHGIVCRASKSVTDAAAGRGIRRPRSRSSAL